MVLAFPNVSSGAERILLIDGTSHTGESESVRDGNVVWRTTSNERILIPIDKILRIEQFHEHPPSPPMSSSPSGGKPTTAKASSDSAVQSGSHLPPLIDTKSLLGRDMPPAISSPSTAVGGELIGVPLLDPLAVEGEETAESPIDLTTPEEAFNDSPTVDTWTSSVPLVGSSVSAITSVLSTAQHTAVAATNQASLWTNRIQLGGNFTNGNSNVDIVDVLTQFERSTAVSLRQMELGGQWSQSTGVVTANRWWLNGNFDWPFSSEEDKWITFLSSKNEYNKLANLNFRGTDTVGIGYRFFYEPKKRLITRIGPAVTVESFDSPDDTRTTFDLFTEVEIRWPIAKRTSLESRIRYQPSLLDGAIYRVFSTSSLLWDLDQENRWKLALNVRTEYISVPSPGRKSTDIFTIVSLVYQRK
ncbi:MAG: hypothetical protein C0478_09415 [Planctomyces sp.]|nr:hypothetical protein [Planctomyces sp.]